MVVSTILLSLCLIFVTGNAIGADHQQNADASLISNGELLGVFGSDSNLLRSQFPQMSQDEGRSLAGADGNVCYTMRSYKVKRIERLQDGQRARRGYTTCEMADNYRLRSAEANVKEAGNK